MTNEIILRVDYNNNITDLDVLVDTPLRIDMSAVEVGELGKLFGIGSQQFTLPGTKKNNRFFNGGKDIGAVDTPGFYDNIPCWVLLNGETVLQGDLQLNEIITDNSGFVHYEVQVTDKSVDFTTELKSKFLKDGNWAPYSHSLSSGSIIDSWNDNLLSGDVFYPLAEYGRLEDDQSPTNYPYLGFYNGDIGSSSTPLQARQFLPAVKIKSTLDVIFDQVGYRYTGSFTETDDFDNLYMLTKANDAFGPNIESGSATFIAGEFTNQVYPEGTTDAIMEASTVSSNPLGAYDGTTNIYTAVASGDHTFNGSISFFNPVTTPAGNEDVAKVRLELKYGDRGVSETLIEAVEEFYLAPDPTTLTLSISATAAISTGDEVWIDLTYEQVSGIGTIGNLTIYNSAYRCTAAPATYEDQNVDMSEQFNAELSSEGIIKALITQFNLVFIPLADDPRTIQIETFDDWMRDGEFKDWTDKYDKAKRIAISHTISELPKKVVLTQADDSDRLSVFTKEQEPYRQYGSLELIAASKNPVGDETLETLFAPVILAGVYDASNQVSSSYNIDRNNITVFPHIYKHDNDKILSYGFKPRIGYKVSNNLPSGSSIYIGTSVSNIEVTGSYSTLSNISQLPAVSGSSNDIHFNNTYGDFVPSSLNINDGITAYENYWKTYYNSIYWDEAKKVTMDLYFEPHEYKTIRLNDRIQIRDQFYRINKIKGFNLSYRDVVTVELIRLYPAYFDGLFEVQLPTPTPTSTPTSTPTATPTATPTNTPTNTPDATPTSTPTATPTATPTSTPLTPPGHGTSEGHSPGPASSTQFKAVWNGTGFAEQQDAQNLLKYITGRSNVASNTDYSLVASSYIEVFNPDSPYQSRGTIYKQVISTARYFVDPTQTVVQIDDLTGIYGDVGANFLATDNYRYENN